MARAAKLQELEMKPKKVPRAMLRGPDVPMVHCMRARVTNTCIILLIRYPNAKEVKAMKMFLEKIHSEGLSHLSYIIGHGGRAAVIDPRRDCDIYPEIAARKGAAVTHIFETHRNEDYVIGSTELALKTGAEIYHGKAFDFDYGNPVSTGDAFEFGDLTFEVIETPGHTYESISISVADRSFGDSPIAVFSGDALFSGDVGRTDFFRARPRKSPGFYTTVFLINFYLWEIMSSCSRPTAPDRFAAAAWRIGSLLL